MMTSSWLWPFSSLGRLRLEGGRERATEKTRKEGENRERLLVDTNV